MSIKLITPPNGSHCWQHRPILNLARTAHPKKNIKPRQHASNLTCTSHPNKPKPNCGGTKDVHEAFMTLAYDKGQEVLLWRSNSALITRRPYNQQRYEILYLSIPAFIITQQQHITSRGRSGIFQLGKGGAHAAAQLPFSLRETVAARSNWYLA